MAASEARPLKAPTEQLLLEIFGRSQPATRTVNQGYTSRMTVEKRQPLLPVNHYQTDRSNGALVRCSPYSDYAAAIPRYFLEDRNQRVSVPMFVMTHQRSVFAFGPSE